MTDLVDLAQTVWAPVESPKIFRDAGPRFLWRKAVWSPGNTSPPHTCYHAEFGRCRSNGWCV